MAKRTPNPRVAAVHTALLENGYRHTIDAAIHDVAFESWQHPDGRQIIIQIGPRDYFNVARGVDGIKMLDVLDVIVKPAPTELRFEENGCSAKPFIGQGWAGLRVDGPDGDTWYVGVTASPQGDAEVGETPDVSTFLYEGATVDLDDATPTTYLIAWPAAKRLTKPPEAINNARRREIIDALASIGANPGPDGLLPSSVGYTLHLAKHHMSALLRAINIAKAPSRQPTYAMGKPHCTGPFPPQAPRKPIDDLPDEIRPGDRFENPSVAHHRFAEESGLKLVKCGDVWEVQTPLVAASAEDSLTNEEIERVAAERARWMSANGYDDCRLDGDDWDWIFEQLGRPLSLEEQDVAQEAARDGYDEV